MNAKKTSSAQPKKVLFIINGMVRNNDVVSVSGGDIRLLEIVRNAGDAFQKFILTTPNGKDFFAKYPDVAYAKMYLLDYNLRAGVLSNLGIVLKSLFYKGVEKTVLEDCIVYSSCEHLYDVIPALKYKLRYGCTWYAVYHWVEDYPWKEKRGNTPFIPRYAYWLNRYVAGWLIKHFSDKVLGVSDPTREKLLQYKKIVPEKVKAVYCGVNYDDLRAIADKYKDEAGTRYDAVFMKRLNYGKGVFDLLQIWKRVVEKKPDATLAIIGDGSEEVIGKIEQYLADNKLDNNVKLLGVIYDTEEKIRVINSAKVFLLPTHEENWAIVIGEAMAVGIPVVVSKLKEITPIWKDNVVWCEVGDIEGFADQVLELVNDPKRAQNLQEKALKFIPRYDWKRIGHDELA